MPRKLHPGQRAQLFTLDVATGESTLLLESSTLLFEAPNWTPDGGRLILNGDGHLWSVAVGEPGAAVRDESALTQVDLAGVPEINNDHVLSPDGATVYVSAEDGHLYAVPAGGGSKRRISKDRGPDFRYYLHGASPDGETLAYIGLEFGPEQPGGGRAVTTNVFTIPAAGGADAQLTEGSYPHDGSEYSPDGRWLYFNSERPGVDADGSRGPDRAPGHAQLFRMPADATAAGPVPHGDPRVEQLTFDERVNWFPHVSPDGQQIAYISFPAGTIGHPADLEVILRLLPVPAASADAAAATPRDMVALPGGQGTINVPSWDPTSTRIAYVAYPLT